MNTYKNIFDSHAHYDDEAFDGDREHIMKSLPGMGVCNVINCGGDIPSSMSSIKLAEKYPYVYAAAGVHPECVKDMPHDWFSQLEKLLSEPKVVAVGEIGLDYHFKENAPRDLQKEFFRRQILLANERSLPIVVHDREAHGDTMDILRELKPLGEVHCFSGSVEMAMEILRLGMYIGIGGAVTFKNARVPVDVVKIVPDDRLLLETDCPYMSPVPFRGKRNDSSLITYTAEKIAEIRGVPVQNILNMTRKNAETLYRVLL